MHPALEALARALKSKFGFEHRGTFGDMTPLVGPGGHRRLLEAGVHDASSTHWHSFESASEEPVDLMALERELSALNLPAFVSDRGGRVEVHVVTVDGKPRRVVAVVEE